MKTLTIEVPDRIAKRLELMTDPRDPGARMGWQRSPATVILYALQELFQQQDRFSQGLEQAWNKHLIRDPKLADLVRERRTRADVKAVRRAIHRQFGRRP
jgi:hypothetical protein